jgi:hypothetical protein
VSIGDEEQRATADVALAAIVPGDPNRNDVFGAEAGEAAAIIRPGDLALSYMWRRLVGDVPGSRMPLANGPVTNAQLLALGCWIEGLAAATLPTDPIDYAACSFYEEPVDFAPAP